MEPIFQSEKAIIQTSDSWFVGMNMKLLSVKTKDYEIQYLQI